MSNLQPLFICTPGIAVTEPQCSIINYLKHYELLGIFKNFILRFLSINFVDDRVVSRWQKARHRKEESKVLHVF